MRSSFGQIVSGIIPYGGEGNWEDAVRPAIPLHFVGPVLQVGTFLKYRQLSMFTR